MIIYMRTTLVLDDELFSKAKQRAATLNSTLSEVVNQALREVLTKRTPHAPPYEMITSGDGEPISHHEPIDLYRALEDEEREHYRKLGRV